MNRGKCLKYLKCKPQFSLRLSGMLFEPSCGRNKLQLLSDVLKLQSSDSVSSQTGLHLQYRSFNLPPVTEQVRLSDISIAVRPPAVRLPPFSFSSVNPD